MLIVLASFWKRATGSGFAGEIWTEFLSSRSGAFLAFLSPMIGLIRLVYVTQGVDIHDVGSSEVGGSTKCGEATSHARPDPSF